MNIDRKGAKIKQTSSSYNPLCDVNYSFSRLRAELAYLFPLLDKSLFNFATC